MYNYKYQGQELQETGFYSFKWRNYMPDVGRFFNIDPLSEKYAYQSPYNFAENKVIAFRELEGLEGIHHTLVDQNGVKSHIIEKNVVILTQNLKTVPNGASDRQVKQIERQNARIQENNQAKVEKITNAINENFGGIHQNGKGENVTFKFNITSKQVDDTSGKTPIDGMDINKFASRNGIESADKKADGTGNKLPRGKPRGIG